MRHEEDPATLRAEADRGFRLYGIGSTHGLGMRSGNVDETVYTRAIVGSRAFLSAYGKEAR